MADKKIEKESFELPNAGAGADIPDLKKKDQERKKAGASWGSAKPTGAPFQGATGGAGVAGGGARAAASAARAIGTAAGESVGGVGVALGAAAQQAGLMGMFSGFASTMMGKVVLGVLAAVMVGGAGVVLKGTGGGAPAAGIGGSGADLGGINSTIKVKRESDSGLGMAANAGRQEGYFPNSAAGPAAGKMEKAESAGDTQQADATNKDQMDRGAGVQTTVGDKMAHDMSGSKLSGAPSASFGGKDIFGGSGSMPKFGATLGAAMPKFATGQGGKSKAATVAKRTTNANRGMQLRGLKSSKALGQLRGMAPLNAAMRGTGVATEANSAAAATQFDGTEVAGGNVPAAPTSQTGGGGGGTGGGTGGSGGGSAPDDTIEQCDSNSYWNGTTCTSMNQGGTNVTPWQKKVDEAKDLKKTIETLLILAAIIATIASYWFKTGCCLWVGTLLFVIAAAIGAVAAMMSMKLVQLGNEINSSGGQPAGNIFTTMGTMYAIASVVTLVAIYFTSQFGLVFTAFGGIMAAIYVLALAYSAFLT